ncbi:hypothetical protein [Heyndrickxia coagulans]|uniref:hypothetical protein n=1 Tax=Heyndrickxia coagulans TaxID=1398 RepID=UPI0023E3C01F|nr:hypothetical protein [Heyndrickxia coagulans]
MDEILKQILSELKDLKSDVSGLKNDVSSLKAGQERIETKVDNLTLELRSNFKFTNDKLEEHKKVFTVVSNELKGVKGDIEFLSGKTGRHDTKINHILNMLRD